MYKTTDLPVSHSQAGSQRHPWSVAGCVQGWGSQEGKGATHHIVSPAQELMSITEQYIIIHLFGIAPHP